MKNYNCIYCDEILTLSITDVYDRIANCRNLKCGKLEIRFIENNITSLVFYEPDGRLYLSEHFIFLYDKFGSRKYSTPFKSNLSNIKLAKEIALKIIKLNLFS